MISIDDLKQKYNLNDDLIKDWHTALQTLGVSDFCVSELDADYPAEVSMLKHISQEKIITKTGLESIPKVYQWIFSYLVEKQHQLPYALIMQNDYLYWLYVQVPHTCHDTRSIPHALGNGVPRKDERYDNIVCAETALFDINEIKDKQYNDLIENSFRYYHVNKDGIWRVMEAGEPL